MEALRMEESELGPKGQGRSSKGFFGEEGFGFEGAVALFDEHLDFAFGGVELLLAGGGEADAFFKELD